MNWDRIEGQRHQLQGRANSTWAKPTEDDIKSVASKRGVLIGKVQMHYGMLRDEAEKQVDAWIAKFPHPAGETQRSNGKDKQAS